MLVRLDAVRRWRIVSTIMLLALTLPLFLFGQPDVASAAPDTLTAEAPLCRFGVNVDNRIASITDYDTSPLRIGWYLDYQARITPSTPNGAEYTQMIRLNQVGADGYSYSPGKSQIEDIIDANPSAIWFVGNEPDGTINQDDIEPAPYADAYHELYNLIKARDTTARIFPGSIIQASELRLQYLDMVLEAYRNTYGVVLPADGWSIHGFILPEVPGQGAGIPPGLEGETGLQIDLQETDNMDIFRQHIERFRNWMAARGYRHLPLYLSEYGVLVPKGLGYIPDFTEGRVNSFMDQTFDYLLTETDENTGYPADNNRLVQRLSWYSVNDKIFFNGYLFDIDNGNNLSLMGQNYAQYVADIEIEVDLVPIQLSVTPGAPLVQDGPADLNISAQIANSGNGQQATAATVRFYDGDPNAGGLQIGSDQNVSINGCGATINAQVDWNSVDPNTYELYVDVQPDSDTDIRPENNRMSKSFSFATNLQLLPIASLPQ